MLSHATAVENGAATVLEAGTILQHSFFLMTALLSDSQGCVRQALCALQDATPRFPITKRTGTRRSLTCPANLIVTCRRQLFQFESSSVPQSDEVDRTAAMSLMSCAARAYLHVGKRVAVEPEPSACHPCSCQNVTTPDGLNHGHGSGGLDGHKCEACCLRWLIHDVRTGVSAHAHSEHGPLRLSL